MIKESIIGIDLGTTNSEVAIVQDGKVIVFDYNGTKVFPSAVGLSPNGELLVGVEARNQYIASPERTVLSVKRLMGGQKKIPLGDSEYLPQEISAMILKRLKSIAEGHLSVAVSKAVITVPAYFSDAQRLATKEAGELAGLEVVKIINEPTAAALAYGVESTEKKHILVYDLGGGTFDVSVVSLESQVVEVLASTGNNHLGGDDFDAKIIEFIETHLKENDIDISQSMQAKARIRHAAERAKITLSDNPFALIEEEYLLEHKGKPYHLSLELSREHYRELIMPYIDETLRAVHKALDEAKLIPSEIDEVLLVGGSTRTPIISEKLREIFKTSPRAEIDPELCVAAGAAVQAGILAGEDCKAVLVDVTPYTFGTSFLGILNGHPSPDVYKAIIRKNTPIPVTKSEVFFTAFDDQDKVEVNVYQGENEDASENIKIGTFIVEGLSEVKAGNPIIVNFNLDADGILQVSAVEKRTKLEKKLVIDNAISQFTEQELHDAKKRLDSLFGEESTLDSEQSINTIESEEDRAFTLMQMAENILGKISSEDGEDLQSLIDEIKKAKAENDTTNLAIKSEKLSDMLIYLEADAA
jgi:molecular chaperone DnaK (HSP70)